MSQHWWQSCPSLGFIDTDHVPGKKHAKHGDAVSLLYDLLYEHACTYIPRLSENYHFLTYTLYLIIMDLLIFVIAEWATLLVDIRCPRGGS